MIYDRERSVAERVYRLMLLAYRPGFRQRYGQEMIEAFRQGQTDRCQPDGVKGLLRFWLFILRDWAGSSLFRFYCLGASAAAILVFWIFLGGRTPTPLQSPNQFVRVARATPVQEQATLEPVVRSLIRRRVTRSHNSLASAGQQRSVFERRAFSLEGPAILLDGAGPTDSIPREFRLIGKSSINRIE